MKFEEPKVEIISLNIADQVVYASSPCGYSQTKCTDLESGGTDSCVNSGGVCSVESWLGN